MTFVKSRHIEPFGIDHVGCGIGIVCNAGSSDTDGDIELPVLCVKIDYSPHPPYLVPGRSATMPAQCYFGWAEGHITTTKPMKGSAFNNFSGESWTVAAAQASPSGGGFLAYSITQKRPSLLHSSINLSSIGVN